MSNMRAIPRIKTRDSTQYCYDSDCAEAGIAKNPSTFRHDPYGVSPLGRVYTDEAHTESVAPSGTLHAELWGLVSFLPYPTTAFEPPPDAIYPVEDTDATVRVFVGQLPYFITEMQLAWILYTFGGRHAVVRPERILKRNPQTGERQPTGCIHAVGSAEGLAQMARLMHKRLLIDDAGVWFCRNEAEYGVLWDYCQAMKRDIKLRPWERPYDSVVVQEATSGSHSRKQQQQHRPQTEHREPAGCATLLPPPYYAGVHSGAKPGRQPSKPSESMGDGRASASLDRDDVYMAH